MIEVIFGIIVFSAFVFIVSYMFYIFWLLKIRADKVRPENDEAMEMMSINDP